MENTAINLQEKLATFSDYWSPRIIAQMNDYHFKLVKFQGQFVWHSHADTDETFIVIHGEMPLGSGMAKIELKTGEMFVVPRAVELNRR